MPTGASIGKVILPVLAVNSPFPLYVTVMSTAFHSFLDSGQGISVLMRYRLSLMDKKSRRREGEGVLVNAGSGLVPVRIKKTGLPGLKKSIAGFLEIRHNPELVDLFPVELL
jgi:hypothetical protein